MRLIDADKLDWWYKGRPIRRVIDEAPTVDAVPVVRCKDCKHWGIQENCEPSLKYFCNAEALYAWGRPVRNADDFCSYGEKRGDVNGLVR
jgi:hypothetical protein